MLPPSTSPTRAVITGAASGLGRAFALELARPGAALILGDVDLTGAEATADKARAAGARVTALRCDVSRVDDVRALATASDALGQGEELVINCAGVAVSGEVGVVPLEDWRHIVEINLMGVVHGCHVFAPRMRTARSGHILNVASLAGLLGTPGMAPYNATKFAVVGLSEALLQELAPHGVGVTVLCPSFFPTNIVEAARRHGGGDEVNVARALMAESKLDAAGVARAALDACRKGRFYSVPMADAKAAWAAKRASPELWVKTLAPRLADLLRRRFANKPTPNEA
ncbi:MAG: SDR family NAD(P)-dependent oxidoreductase [Myxococcales bacterium]|nr:SDR family NAD(P)-dependent oxidoreductase [Myxococcales bacterium]